MCGNQAGKPLRKKFVFPRDREKLSYAISYGLKHEVTVLPFINTSINFINSHSHLVVSRTRLMP
jgi:hypothetical protein